MVGGGLDGGFDEDDDDEDDDAAVAVGVPSDEDGAVALSQLTTPCECGSCTKPTAPTISTIFANEVSVRSDAGTRRAGEAPQLSP